MPRCDICGSIHPLLGKMTKIDLITQRYDPLDEYFDDEVACINCHSWVWAIENRHNLDLVIKNIAAIIGASFLKKMSYPEFNDRLGDVNNSIDFGVDL
jgi:hypothetical protein